MYYVDRKQIEQRLAFIPVLIQAFGELEAVQFDMNKRILIRFARERVIHLALEVVTDIGSLLIDGFLMREASSYEDIIEVIRDEAVMDKDTAAVLLDLVRLRKPLVQQYLEIEETELERTAELLPTALRRFADQLKQYLHTELGEAAIPPIN
jgi:uncharacterized protein YutE (UPF0331/DUF86 family)